ncbi:DUF1156 domain-containing protein [Pectobacterium aroidearum]|uniref:DUF1156 domain-containing protein n=1 Tax=Pectobacterium aroidearum TaxID=1201031 RepID=UPI001CD34A9E|nr:DUF1156 domain-containing protein [Pectobacterium aroidearum]
MKRLIEEFFPVEQISDSCRREKSVRQGHISTLQTWWARRPLAVCRATIFLASLPSKEVLLNNIAVREILSGLYPEKDSFDEQLMEFVSEMSDFSNSNNDIIINAARNIILQVNKNPSLADTFSGGGSIPLESARLGLKTYASDLNPIATVGLKLMLAYAPGMSEVSFKRLENDIDYISEQLTFELSANYNNMNDLAYFWAKTFICPHCNLRTPLFQNKWLSKNGVKKSLKITPHLTTGSIKVCVHEPISDADFLDADIGTVASKKAHCLFCNEDVGTDEIMRQGIAKLLGEVQYARLTIVDGKKKYLSPSQPIDLQNEETIKNKEHFYFNDEFVDLKLPLDLNGIRHLWAIQYGIETVNDLFNPRQRQVVQSLTKIIMKRRGFIEETSDSEDEVMFRYLSLIMIMNKVTIYSNRHSWWQSNGAFPANIFVRQAISMVWNYVEIPPTSTGAGGWHSASKWVVKALQQLATVKGQATVSQEDAADTSIPNNSLDLVVIDPPYFDSITYAYLSDFFYPWTKKILRTDFPHWFEAEVTPKSQELIVDRQHKLAPTPKNGEFFAQKMAECLINSRKKLTPNGLIVLMYGHKELTAWVALFEAIKRSGLRVTVSWPVQTERKSKFQHSRVGALGTSCLLVLRQVEVEHVTLKSVKNEDFKLLALSRMSHLKVSNPDLEADQVALSMAVFPLVLDDYMHCNVVDEQGEKVSIDKLLDSIHL